MAQGKHSAQTHHLCSLQFIPPALKMIMQVAYILKIESLVTISFVTASYFSLEVISSMIQYWLFLLRLRDAVSFPHLPETPFDSGLAGWRHPSVQLDVSLDLRLIGITICHCHEQMVYISGTLEGGKK